MSVSKKTPFVVFVLLSALLHSLLFFLRVRIEGEDESMVSVYLLEETQMPLSRSAPLLSEKPVDDRREREEKKEDLPSGQVVDIARPEEERRPDESRFLAKWDSVVPRETKSLFDKDVPVRGKKLQRLAMPLRTKVVPTIEDAAIPGEYQEQREKIEEQVKKGTIAGFEGEYGDLQRGTERQEPGRLTGTESVDRKGQEPSELRLPARYLPYFWGSDTALTSPSNDYLTNVPDGDETALNTRRFLYADYYNRIKQAVSYHWAPGKVLMVHDPGGNIFGFKDRYTKIEAVIDAHGAVVDIRVVLSSGADVLDREAVDAFRAAAPFPNPPVPLLKDGYLTMQLGFYVEIR